MTKAFIEILLQAIVAAAGTSALIVYLPQKRSVRRNAAFLIVEQIDNLKHDIADISTYASKTKPSMGWRSTSQSPYSGKTNGKTISIFSFPHLTEKASGLLTSFIHWPISLTNSRIL